MDVLSDTLRVVRLAGAVFFTADLASPWAVSSPPSADISRFLRLRTDCVALFHVLTKGTCWVSVEGSRPVWMEAGDVVIFPHASPHVMGSTLDITPTPLGAILRMPPGDEIPAIQVGGSGDTTHFVCGYLYCDQRFNPLIGALPQLLHVSMRPLNEQRNTPNAASSNVRAQASLAASHVLPVQAGDWLELTLRHTVEEARTQHPGSSAMMARLTEIVFVEVLRRYMQHLPAEHGGWLAGVRDPVVGQALRLLHAQPERPWTVDDLAQATAVSRSTLAQRFLDLIGDSPIHYLAQWRIHVAKQLLLQTSLSMREIALRVGYESEVAFNRAFRRHVGQPPATWRLKSGESE